MIYGCICLNPGSSTAGNICYGTVREFSNSTDYAFVTVFGSRKVPVASWAPGVPMAITSDPCIGQRWTYVKEWNPMCIYLDEREITILIHIDIVAL